DQAAGNDGGLVGREASDLEQRAGEGKKIGGTDGRHGRHPSGRRVEKRDFLTREHFFRARRGLRYADLVGLCSGERLSNNPSPLPPPRDGEGEPSLSFSPSPLRGGGRGERFPPIGRIRP